MMITLALAPTLARRARARAKAAGTSLDMVLTRYLLTYVEHGSPTSKGGHAANAKRTKAERSALARRAVNARWARVREAQEGR